MEERKSLSDDEIRDEGSRGRGVVDHDTDDQDTTDTTDTTDSDADTDDAS